jgi:hypothetical protein
MSNPFIGSRHLGMVRLSVMKYQLAYYYFQ